jgi:hypothetical protein
VNVTNSGTIIGGFQGIYAGTTANVINTGTIAGLAIDGIFATNLSVANSGTISGGDFDGIFAQFGTVWNSGIISGGVTGIHGSQVLNVVNYGLVRGGNTAGIDGAKINVINYGGIYGPTGIQIYNVGDVTNAGAIVGDVAAINFAGNADSLTLLPGSTIVGAINLGGGGDTVNFRGGNHNLTFDSLTGATVTGNTPFAVLDNRAAAIDPTPFAMANRTLMDFTRGISGVLESRSGEAGSPAANSFAATGGQVAARVDEIINPALAFAGANDRMFFKAPSAVNADGTGVWARGFAGERVQQAGGPLLRATTDFYGGALGIDGLARPDLRIGGFIGAGTSRTGIDFNSQNEADMVFGGLNGRWRISSVFLDMAAHGGYLRNRDSRTINNNTLPGGVETATAAYSGWYLSPELAIGTQYALASWYSIVPVVRVRYLNASLDGYTESGSTANLTVGTRTIQDVEERAEVKLIVSVLQGASASVHGGVIGVQRLGDTTVNTVLLGQNMPFATPGKGSVSGLFGGLGLDWRYRNATYFAGAEYIGMSDSSSVIWGKAGVRVSF